MRAATFRPYVWMRRGNFSAVCYYIHGCMRDATQVNSEHLVSGASVIVRMNSSSNKRTRRFVSESEKTKLK